MKPRNAKGALASALLLATALFLPACGEGITDRMTFLFLIGGHDADAAKKSAAVFRSSDGDTWTHVGDLPEGRAWGAAAVFEGRIWYMGGFSSVDEQEVWSSADGETWREEPPLAEALSDSAAVVFANEIWLLGGHSGAAAVDGTYSFDGEDWTSHPGVLGEYTNGAAAAYGGKIWLVGGQDSVGETGAVSISSNGTSWDGIDPIAPVRYGSRLAELGGDLIAIGGNDGTFTLDLVERISGGDQEVISHLPEERVFPAVSVFDNEVYVIGGGTSTTPSTATDTVYISDDGVTWNTRTNFPLRLTGASLVTFKP